MFHLNARGWLVGGDDPAGERNRFDFVVLHEARTATDYHRNQAHDAELAAQQRDRTARIHEPPQANSSRGLVACCA